METTTRFADLKFGQGFTFAGDDQSNYYIKHWNNLYLDPNVRYARPVRTASDTPVIPQ